MADLNRDEIMTKWVRALRSGKYKQGTSFLRAKLVNDVERFCCLGVLCDVVPGVQWVEQKSGSCVHWFAKFEDSQNGSTLPMKLVIKLDLLGSGGGIRCAELPKKWTKKFSKITGVELDHELLVSLNDGNMPFSDIADLIEQHPEALHANANKK